jgi:hypothetical protein
MLGMGNNWDGDADSFAAHICSISDTCLRFPVGSGYAYSNLGIDLAGYVLQAVSSRSRTMTPRKPKSGWTRLNRQRVAALEAQGRMTDAGRRAVEVAKANRSWTIYDAVEDLTEPSAWRLPSPTLPGPAPHGTASRRRLASRCCGG